MTAVVFDFDGVLADTEGLHLRAFQEAFAARGWALDPAVYADRYLGYDDRTLIVEFAADEGFSIDAGECRPRDAGKSGHFRPAASDRFRRLPVSASLRADAGGALSAGHRLRIASRGNRLDSGWRQPPVRRFGASCRPKTSREASRRPTAICAPPRCLASIRDAASSSRTRTGDSTRPASAGMKTIGLTTTTNASALSAADRIIGSLDEFRQPLSTILPAEARRDKYFNDVHLRGTRITTITVT